MFVLTMKQTPNGTTNTVKKHNLPASQALPAPDKTVSLPTCGNLCNNLFPAILYDCTTWVLPLRSTIKYNCFLRMEWYLHILLCLASFSECSFVRFIPRVCNMQFVHLYCCKEFHHRYIQCIYVPECPTLFHPSVFCSGLFFSFEYVSPFWTQLKYHLLFETFLEWPAPSWTPNRPSTHVDRTWQA